MLDLNLPGAYCRTAGGNLQRPFDQKPVVRWMAWSINADNGGDGDPKVWDICRLLWAENDIAHFPWKHCRSMADIDQLLFVGQNYGSPAIGLNIEDVKTDFTDRGVSLLDIAQKLGGWDLPIHMATLPWVQNGQGWQALSRCVAALEIFADEQASIFPTGEPDPVVVNQCVAHAHTEGLPKVTLMLKTSKFTKEDYGPSFPICHSLYTADDITPDAPSWLAWKLERECIAPKPPQPNVPLTPKQVPYTGPYYGPGNAKGPNKGPTAHALKRAMIRLGLFDGDLGELDEHYNAKLELSVKRFQRTLEDVAATGQYGKATWYGIRAAKVPVGKPNSGEYALDKLAQEMIQREAKIEAVEDSPETKIRNALTDFCLRAEANEAKWSYSQRRPYTGLGLPPETQHANDCSSYVCLAYYHARLQTGILVPDPAGYGFSGYGNTWDDLDGHEKVSGIYRVGDLAHYDGHVTLCRKEGDFLSSIWSSFGREAGPEDFPLNYRDDLRFVVRPPLT